MIQLDQVRKWYQAGGQQVDALQELTARIDAGEFVVVTGRSGAGKSTLLSVVGGLITPDTGRVLVAGQDLRAMPDAERSRLRCRTMGFVFQFASLIPTLTVTENVLLPATFLPPGEAPGRGRALELLERVGLREQVGRMPWQLSGGQQKRVAVARALLHNPALLLADEPTADLDEETEREIIALLAELNKAGTTVLLATHNTDLAALATRHLVLSGGRVARAS
ncbi:MAG TPA: ABC transporter ATP-binding protein [Symbiobacteriaceae bacterium]|jgi:ABC-type lipoprotein export system ATPase subunit|nr:ABC transporter ATP-binding protein [Symbiobacteriaceae bacterium]